VLWVKKDLFMFVPVAVLTLGALGKEGLYMLVPVAVLTLGTLGKERLVHVSAGGCPDT